MKSRTSITPYQPSQRFLDQCREYGVDLKQPDVLLSAHNREAEALLPKARPSGWRSRWFSVVPLLAAFSPAVMGFTGGGESSVGRTVLLLLALMIGAQVLMVVFGVMSSAFHLIHWRAVRDLPEKLEAIESQLKKVRRAVISISPTVPVPHPEPEPEEPPRNDEADQPPTRRPGLIMLGGATRQGLVRKENQDAYRVGLFGAELGSMMVCDGVGGHPGGREASAFASDHMIQWLSVALRSSSPSCEVLSGALASAQKAFEANGIEGLTTAIVVFMDGPVMHYAVLGDGDLIVIHPDGITQSVLAPHHDPNGPDSMITAYLSGEEAFVPRMGSVVLEPNALVLAMSDGAADLLPLEQIAEYRDWYLSSLADTGVDQVCDQILQTIEQARDPETGALLHSDNITLALAAYRPEGQS